MQEKKYSIKQWAKDDRPREKLLSRGAENLSHSELLAILIHHGSKEKSALDLAQEILKKGKNSLAELGKLTPKELMKIPGIGEAKAVTIVAALELGRRRQSYAEVGKPVILSSQDIAQLLQSRLQDKRKEVFAVVYLNRANKVIEIDSISQGGLTGTVADPRVILKRALEENAVSIALGHNHPSGSLKPSRADEDLTRKIKEACRYFDIRLLDHIIVSDEGYFSFADEGLL